MIWWFLAGAAYATMGILTGYQTMRINFDRAIGLPDAMQREKWLLMPLNLVIWPAYIGLFVLIFVIRFYCGYPRKRPDA